jgi:hypothetical protein
VAARPLWTLLVAMGAATVLAACGGGEEPDTGDTAERFFSTSSFWNAPLPADAPLDEQSEALSERLRSEAEKEVSAGTGPWIETQDYTTTVYTVGADQPTAKVELLDVGPDPEGTLQAAFEAVPIPEGARPAGGTDGHMTIWQPSTDKLWEFWRAANVDGSWQAHWGGAMENVSQNPGYYTSEAWRGAKPNWGATATSLPVIGGTILLDELEQGSIGHALALNIPVARANQFSWPAQRSDGGWDSQQAIPEGARFRLDPDLDLDSLDLPPLVRMLAEAAQRYGMVVRDQTGEAISFSVENAAAESPEQNPFWTSEGEPSADGYLEGQWPSALLSKFPWDHLELLDMSLCESAPCHPPESFAAQAG